MLKMKILFRYMYIAIFGLSLVACSGPNKDGYNIEAKNYVNESLSQIRHTLYQSSMGTELSKTLSESHAVIIFPRNFGVGFGALGATGGTGIMLVRGANGQWSYPIFLKTFGVNLGLSFGIYYGSVVVVIRSPVDVNSLLDSKFHFGLNIGAAIVNSGKYLDYKLVFPSDVWIKSYGLINGLYLGASFEFGGIILDDELTKEYYRHTELKNGIQLLRSGNYRNPHADPLRALLSEFTIKK